MLLAFFVVRGRRRGGGVAMVATLFDVFFFDAAVHDFAFFLVDVVFFLGDEALVDFCRRLGGLGVVLEDPSLNATEAAAAPG